MKHSEMFDLDNDYLEHVEIIEDGEWINDYKDYDFKTDIVKVNNKYYEVTHNRSGNYYSDYEYGEPSFFEVKPVKVTVTQYHKV